MTNKLQSIQALRGIACLAVVAFHYRGALAQQFPTVKQVLGMGAIGVDLFFILSGFVITLSVSRMGCGFAAAGDFLKRRALRLLPAYYLLIVVNLLFGGALSFLHYPEKLKAIAAALTLSVYMPQHAPFYMDDDGFLNVRWTLNYEFFFYLMMAACLFVRARWLALVGALCLTMVVLPLVAGNELTMSTQGYQMGYSYLNLMTNPIIWQFAVGVLIGLAYPHMARLPLITRVPFMIAAVVLMVSHVYSRTHAGHGLMESGAILALLLAAVAFNNDWLDRITPRWLAFVGDISFSVYLLHIVTYRVVSKRIADDGVTLFVSAIAASILVGWLSYRYIEPVGYKVAAYRAKKAALKQQREGEQLASASS